MSTNCSHPTCMDSEVCRREKKEKAVKPLKRSPLKKTAKKIKPMSDKLKTRMKDYTRQKKAFMEAHPLCQTQIEGVCQHTAVDIHHAKGREGALLTNEEYWVAICRPCHDWCHQNDAQARQLGLLLSRLTK